MSKVFISYQNKDRVIAEYLARMFTKHSIEFFLDAYDPVLGDGGSPVDAYIRDMLGKCTHLMTILSLNTVESWWVPFEIGIATEKDIPVANYFFVPIEVPEYLTKWPYLENEDDLLEYISLVLSNKETLMRKYSIANIRPRYSDAFEIELKYRLSK